MKNNRALVIEPTTNMMIDRHGKLTKTSPDTLAINCRLRGATVARLTPDQKAACSNHVGVKKFLGGNILIFGKYEKLKDIGDAGDRTRGLSHAKRTLYH